MRYYNLIPLICGERLFLSANEDDFILDGHTVRRFKDIRKVQAKDDKCDEILRSEGIVVSTPEVEIDNWRTVFQSLKKTGKNIIIEKEDLDYDNTEYVIGKIADIHKKFAYVYHFDADGIWEEKPYRIPFDEITSVTFGSRYVEIFSKYIDEPTMC